MHWEAGSAFGECCGRVATQSSCVAIDASLNNPVLARETSFVCSYPVCTGLCELTVISFILEIQKRMPLNHHLGEDGRRRSNMCMGFIIQRRMRTRMQNVIRINLLPVKMLFFVDEMQRDDEYVEKNHCHDGYEWLKQGFIYSNEHAVIRHPTGSCWS